MATHAVLYYTHFVSAAVKKEVEILDRELGPEFTLFAIGCCPENSTLDDLASENVQVRSYTRDNLRSLPYARQLESVDWKTLRGNPDLGIMRFFRGNPGFDFYWVIEYDVRFTGSWTDLFEDLKNSNADMLCTHVTSFLHDKDWAHWSSFSAGEDIVTEENMIRGFLPFSRMSNTLMRAIDDRCSRGWTGHNEVLWPSIVKAIGGTIEEIGGNGASVPASRKGKYYFSAFWPSGLFLSTFGAWPSYSVKSNFRAGSPSDILWHPVKE
jgi:hypothetical protein